MKIQLKIMSAALVVTLAATYGYTAWKKQETVADAAKIEPVTPVVNQTTAESKEENLEAVDKLVFLLKILYFGGTQMYPHVRKDR